MINLDYLYNPAVTKDDDLFSIDRFDDKKLTFQIIDKGMILPHKAIVDGKPTADGWGYGGLVDGNGEYIASSHVKFNPGKGYTPPQESIQHSSETVIYLGMFHSTWGHVITDNIKRL